MSVESGPLRKYRDEERPGLPGNGQAACYDCGLHYADTGFCDFVIPDEAWEAINPTHHRGAGLLCAVCICRRLTAAGLEHVPGRFASGPCATHA